jgi:aspartyl-tRNA(Asn)/glutamyl-tRNA(Gln) amidotransferase subunit A
MGRPRGEAAVKPIHELAARDIAASVREGKLSAVEVVSAFIERIGRFEPKIKAFVSLRPEQALDEAKRIDDARARGEKLGPLAGVPVALKDNICTKGWETTCCSRILRNFKPPYDATVVENLRAAGAIVIGKANMDEFAFGSSTENSCCGPSRNPWNVERVPGGSSGGSAAAVSARFAPLALGSDTGGSVRQPAGFCGIVAAKPSYGRVSRCGLIAFGSSLDQISPFATDAADLALLLRVMAGYDRRDSTSVNAPVPDYLAEFEKPVGRMRLGVAKEYLSEGVEPGTRQRIAEAADTFRSLGFDVVEISLPHTPWSVAVYYVVATAEASSNLARFDGVHYGHRTAEKVGLVDLYSQSREEGFGPEVKRRIMLGTYVLSSGYYDAYYLKGLKVRRLMKQDFDRAFEQVDAVICPTSPTTAFKIGERAMDPLAMYLADIFTIPANMAGIPGVSIPCGFDEKNLPVGMQIMAPIFEEARLLRIAHAFQQATDFHLRRPEL